MAPYSRKIERSLKKEKKLYLWDWSEHTDEGKKWENFIGSQLLKYCHYHEDIHGDKMELRFIRDIMKREIDFVVLKNKKPLFAVECKTGETKPSPHLNYFAERSEIPKFYQVHQGKRSYSQTDLIHILPFQEFSKIVGLV